MNKTRTKVTGKLKLVAFILVTIDYITIVTDDLFLLSLLCNDKNTFIRQGWANNFWTHCICSLNPGLPMETRRAMIQAEIERRKSEAPANSSPKADEAK